MGKTKKNGRASTQRERHIHQAVSLLVGSDCETIGQTRAKKKMHSELHTLNTLLHLLASSFVALHGSDEGEVIAVLPVRES